MINCSVALKGECCLCKSAPLNTWSLSNIGVNKIINSLIAFFFCYQTAKVNRKCCLINVQKTNFSKLQIVSLS